MIDDTIQFPGSNGAEPPMTAQERKVWAASKGLPSNYLIVTIEEMMAMRNSMTEQRAQCSDMSERFKKCIALLGAYWTTEPDLTNAVAAAAFDAARYTKLADQAPKLQKIKDRLEAAIRLAGPSLEPVVFADLMEVSTELGNVFVFIVEQMALRRDRAKAKK